MREWCLGGLLAVMASVSGCSALFDGGRHVGSGSDAGPADAQTEVDAEVDAGAVDACDSHLDCLDRLSIDPLVCRPSPAGGACAATCNAAEECDGRAGVGEHPFGTLCVAGACGCTDDTHCPDPFFDRCFMGVCGECAVHRDCDPMGTTGPQTFCFDGLCEQSGPCETDADCSEPFPHCAGMGDNRVCVPPCRDDMDCPDSARCAIDMGSRCVPR